jgi:NIPSNAP
MMTKGTLGAVMFAMGLMGGLALRSAPAAEAQGAGAARVFEIRTYTTPDAAKLDVLKTRFRDHTITIFNRHGMKSVGYWTPEDAPLKDNTLIYILAHPSREAAKKNWDDFRKDPEWVKVKADSEVNGAVTTKVESLFVDATDFSPIK